MYDAVHLTVPRVQHIYILSQSDGILTYAIATPCQSHLCLTIYLDFFILFYFIQLHTLLGYICDNTYLSFFVIHTLIVYLLDS